MIRYIIYFIIIAVVLWKGKPYIEGYILNWKEKRKKKNIKEVNPDFIYSPINSSRTFYFAIEINELGEGKVTLNVVKPKDLQ